jgi:hypothetical protein
MHYKDIEPAKYVYAADWANRAAAEAEVTRSKRQVSRRTPLLTPRTYDAPLTISTEPQWHKWVR